MVIPGFNFIKICWDWYLTYNAC